MTHHLDTRLKSYDQNCMGSKLQFKLISFQKSPSDNQLSLGYNRLAQN